MKVTNGGGKPGGFTVGFCFCNRFHVTTKITSIGLKPRCFREKLIFLATEGEQKTAANYKVRKEATVSVSPSPPPQPCNIII